MRALLPGTEAHVLTELNHTVHTPDGLGAERITLPACGAIKPTSPKQRTLRFLLQGGMLTHLPDKPLAEVTEEANIPGRNEGGQTNRPQINTPQTDSPQTNRPQVHRN